MAYDMTEHAQGGVYISLEAMYQQQQETYQAVRELSRDVRAALDLEERVRALEKALGDAAGPPRAGGTLTPAAAVTALLTALGTAVWQVISGG